MDPTNRGLNIGTNTMSILELNYYGPIQQELSAVLCTYSLEVKCSTMDLLHRV